DGVSPAFRSISRASQASAIRTHRSGVRFRIHSGGEGEIYDASTSLTRSARYSAIFSAISGGTGLMRPFDLFSLVAAFKLRLRRSSARFSALSTNALTFLSGQWFSSDAWTNA